MRNPVAKAPEYKQFAADCLRWAAEVEQDEDKEALLGMAQDFALAASQLETGRLSERDSDDHRLSKADFDPSART